MNISRSLTSAVLLVTLTGISFGNLALADELIHVVAKPLSSVAFYPQLKAPANVVSNSDSRISAEVSARIIAIPARVGDNVNKNDVIVRMAREDLQLLLHRQQAGLAALAARITLADYELKRAQSLSKKQAVSEQLLKQRESQLKTLLAEQQGQRAAVQQAQRNLDKTIIRAPFLGTITEHLAHIGELATPGTPLIHIVDTSSLEVSAKIQAHHAADVAQAKSLTLLSAGKKYPLTLRAITSVINNQTRTREVRLLFKDPSFTDQGAMPGSSGELLWQRVLISLPAELIIKRQGKLGVFTLLDNKAYFSILPNAEEGRPAVTKLSPDTLIITEGRFRLQDGNVVVAQ